MLLKVSIPFPPYGFEHDPLEFTYESKIYGFCPPTMRDCIRSRGICVQAALNDERKKVENM